MHDQKKRVSSTSSDYYTKLSLHPIVKDCLDEYLNPDGKFLKWAKILYEFCEQNERLPKYKEKIDGIGIGYWLSRMRRKSRTDNVTRIKMCNIHPIVNENF